MEVILKNLTSIAKKGIKAWQNLDLEKKIGLNEKLVNNATTNEAHVAAC